MNGKEALFPSTYVEKLPEAASTNGRPVPPARGASAGANGKPAYRPFMAAHAGSSTVAPPPPGGGTNAVGLQEDAGQDQKKSKFGKYGNTVRFYFLLFPSRSESLLGLDLVYWIVVSILTLCVVLCADGPLSRRGSRIWCW